MVGMILEPPVTTHDEMKQMMTKTVQFQQSIYSSTAKRAEGLQGVIEGMQDLLEDGEDAWNEVDYNTHKSQVQPCTGATRRAVIVLHSTHPPPTTTPRFHDAPSPR